MSRARLITWGIASVFLCAHLHAQSIFTVAGGGTDDGRPAIAAALNLPQRVAADSSGNIYIADRAHDRIRKVAAATGVITTVAGNGAHGFSGDGGPATEASLSWPLGLVVDASGNVYFADGPNRVVRKVNAATGVITTVAGRGSFGFSGDGGPATAASLSAADVTVDSSGEPLHSR